MDRLPESSPLSVMTVVYNGEKFLPRCYRNLLQQTFTNWEWIVVDDGSTDATASMLREIQSRESRMHLVTLPKQCGRGTARTAAVEKASCDWIAVWDVDDFYLPHRLARVDVARREGFDYYSSTAIVLDRHLELIGVRGWHDPLPPSGIRTGCHAAIAMRTDLARRIGYLSQLKTVGQIGEDVPIGYTLATQYKGLLDDEPSFVNVIGHEVFLRKSIDSNRVRMDYLHQMFERGQIPLTREQFDRLEQADRRKLRFLRCFWLFPPAYRWMMSFRPRGHLIPHRALTAAEAEFIEGLRKSGASMDTSSRAPAEIMAASV